MKKRLTMVMAVVCCLALMVGTLAFFTDRATADTTATAGNINLTWTDTSTGTAGSNNTFAQAQAWDAATGGLVTEGKIINPGDYFDLSYTLKNTGNKSIDVRQQLVLTSDTPMTEDAEEYQLTVISVGGETAIAEAIVSDDGLTITYNLKDIVINGSIEEETGAFTYADGAAYTVRLDFDIDAMNAFMDSIVDVDLYATAKQHRNTSETDFPAFTAMASVSNNAAPETVGTKTVEKIAD